MNRTDRQHLLFVILVGVLLGLAGYLLVHHVGVNDAPTSIYGGR